MPQVPYNPVPEAPGFAPSGPLAPRVSPDAFGVNVGHAIQGFGGQLEKSGNELWNRAMWIQQLRNDSEARDLTVRAINETNDLRANYLTTQGKGATDAYPKFKQDFQSKFDEIGGNASNPMVQKLYKDQTQFLYAREMSNAATHMAAETKKYGNQTIDAQIEANHSLNQQNPDDTVNAALRHVDNNALIEHKGLQEGWSPDKIKVEQAKSTSDGLYSTLKGIGIKSASAARQFWEEHKGEFFGDDRIRSEKFVQDTENTLGAKQIEHSLTSGDYLSRLQLTENATGGLHTRAPTSTAEGLYQFTQGTWRDVRAAHPNLNLPASISQANAQQQKDAELAFRTDNVAQLEKAGVDTNQKNTYLAHFLGAGGAVKFWNGMKADPGQPATNLVGADQARANRRIFFNPDGSPKTAGEAYVTATANFMGPGEFTKDSTGKDLELGMKDAATIARNLSPYNPTMEERAVQLVEQKFHRVKTEYRAAQAQTRNELETFLLGNGDPNKRITSFDAIQTDPILNAKYLSLDGPEQKTILSLVSTNARAADAPTQQQKAEAITILGSFKQGSGKYLDYDVSRLPPTLAAQVSVAKQGFLRHQEMDVHLKQALTVSKDYIKALHLEAGGDEYDNFVGEMDQRLQDYLAGHDNKPPPETTYREWAKDLAASTGGWSGFFGGVKFQVPSEFRNKIEKLWPKFRTDTLTPISLGKMYQYSLDHPDWEQRLTQDRVANE